MRKRFGVSTRITFHGALCYEVESSTSRVLIDPFFDENPKTIVAAADVRTPDVILVTHGARDHYGDAAKIAARTGAPVVCDPAVRLKLIDDGVASAQIRATMWGVRVIVGGVQVTPVESRHFSMVTLSNGAIVTGQPLAFVWDAEPDVRIFHAGDSAYFNLRAVRDVHAPSIALIGVTVPTELLSWAPGAGLLASGETTADEAARMAEALGVTTVVAGHYLEVDSEAELFPSLVARHDSTCNRVALVPDIGDVIVVDDGCVRVERGGES
jgi:L-ascorbate metabolism protein UlaG (beta-lactamase superfamily)